MKFSKKRLRKYEKSEVEKLISKFTDDIWLYINAHNMNNKQIYNYALSLYKENLLIEDPSFNSMSGYMKFKNHKNYSDTNLKYDNKKSLVQNIQKNRKNVRKQEVLEEIMDTDVILMSALNGSLTERVINDKIFRKELKSFCKLEKKKEPIVLKSNLTKYMNKNNNMDIFDDLLDTRGY